MKPLRLAVAAVSAAVAVSACPSASAQSRTGFAVDRFEPAARGSRFFVTDTLDLRGHLRPVLGAVTDYAHLPLVVADPATGEKEVVRHQLFEHFGGSIVLFDRLRLAASFPLALVQDGDDATVSKERLKAPDTAAIGDFRIGADARLVGAATDPLTLAVGVRAWLPTGVRSQFTGDGSARLAPQVLVAGELGLLSYGARAAVAYRSRDDVYAGAKLGSELSGAASLGLRSPNRRLLVGPEIWASTGITSERALFGERTTPVEWLLGLHYDPIDDLRVGAGVGGGLTDGYGAPDLRGLFSVEWVPDAASSARAAEGEESDDEEALPRPADTDGDGVLDVEDTCPSRPGRRTEDPMTNGCPPDAAPSPAVR